jgi:hypothetical protein
MTEAERLAAVCDFIAAESAKPFVWGETDCCSTADRWIQIIRGISPITLFDEWDRGQSEADNCLSHPYALPVRVNRALRLAGIWRTSTPQAGDIALAIFGDSIGVAIHAGTCWLSRGRGGIVGAPVANFWKAWAV